MPQTFPHNCPRTSKKTLKTRKRQQNGFWLRQRQRKIQQFYLNDPIIKNMRSKTYEKRRGSIPRMNQPERSSPVLRYYLGNGNNAELVRKVLSTRKNWEEVGDSKFMFLNFKWQQSSKGYNFDGCVDTKIFKHCLNHLEFHQELSNKEMLLKNLSDYCEANKMNVFNYVPVTYVLNISDPNLDTQQNLFIKFFQANLPENMKNSDRKLWLNLPRRRYSSQGHEYRQGYFFCRPEIRPMFSVKDNSQYLWILKPSFRNCGKGIHVFNKIETLQTLIKSYLEQNNSSLIIKSTADNNAATNINQPQDSSQANKKKQFRIRDSQFACSSISRSSSNFSFVIQKYLERPLLIDGRKFDIRVWVLFAHDFKVYFFKEGYVRTSSSMYSISQDSFDDVAVHLTNNAIQKYGEEYGKYEEGNQLSFKFLSSYISKKGGNFENILNEMKKIVKMTAFSVKRKINKANRQNCFEIFGYDFMIDDELKPWLIEANTNPCIEESSLILENLLPRMLDDAFKLTLDQIFPQSNEGHKTQYVVQNYQNNINMWQLITDLKRHN